MMTHNKLLFVLFLSFSFQFISSQNTQQLFNSKNLKGWYAFNKKTGKQHDALKMFAVENNMIRLYGENIGYVITKKSFKNFELNLNFRWNTDTTFVKKSSNQNSGVMYLIPKKTPDTLWPKGIQFQIKEQATGDFILLQNVTLTVNNINIEPGKSVVSKRFADAENPIGEWNTLTIICNNGVIEQKLNGKLVNKGTNPSVLKGRILLQYEGFPIDFKNLTIKKL